VTPDVSLDLHADSASIRTNERASTMSPATPIRAHHSRRARGTPTRRLTSVLAIVLGAFAAAACEQITPIIGAIVDNTHTLEVVNRCGGPNATVGLYLNGAHVGTVYYRREFAVRSGPLTLRAVGTGPGATTFTNATTVRGNLVWTLCSVGGLSTDQEVAAD
jgi:hypothetical protein